MGNLDKPVSDLTLPELQRLIRQEISRQVPPIPARLLELADSDDPLLTPLFSNNANALVYSAESGQWNSGKIVAESLEAVLVLANTIIAGNAEMGRVELGLGTGDMEGMIGIHAMRDDGVITFMIDAETGEVFIKGRVDFGTGSRLTVDDLLELHEQTPTGFQTPTTVQVRSGATATGGASSMSAGWTSPTISGNCLLMVVSCWDADGTVPTPSTPAGWTLLKSVAAEEQFIYIYRATTGSSRSGVQAITLGDSVFGVMHLIELSGVQVLAQDKDANNSGNSNTADSGTTSTTTQNEEIWLGVLCNRTEVDTTGAANQDDPTNDFERLSNRGALKSGPFGLLVTQHNQYIYTKNVTATGTANVSATLSGSLGTNPWVGAVLALKAKAAGVETPGGGLARLFTKPAGTGAALHVKHENGSEYSVALAPAGSTYSFQIVSATVDIPSTPAHSGGNMNVTIPGLAVNEFCTFFGTGAAATRAFNKHTRAVCGTANTIVLDYFNTEAVVVDPNADTFYFLVIHRT